MYTVVVDQDSESIGTSASDKKSDRNSFRMGEIKNKTIKKLY